MVNSNMLKSKMSDKAFTQRKLAQRLGIAQATMNQKINNIRPITLNEAGIISQELDISAEEFGVVFFGQELRNATAGGF